MKINIKDKLEEKNMNRNQFAKAMQIGYPAACALYDGTTSKIEFNTLESICRVLDCTPNDIIITDDPKVSKLIAYECNIRKIVESQGGTE